MPRTAVLHSILAFALGLAMAWVSVFTLGLTAVIAAPEQYFQWWSSPMAAFIVWDVLVIQGLAVGLPTALLTWLLVRYDKSPWLALCASLVAGQLAVMYLLFDAPLVRLWWQYSYELVLTGSALGVGIWAAHVRHRRVAATSPA